MPVFVVQAELHFLYTIMSLPTRLDLSCRDFKTAVFCRHRQGYLQSRQHHIDVAMRTTFDEYAHAANKSKVRASLPLLLSTLNTKPFGSEYF